MQIVYFMNKIFKRLLILYCLLMLDGININIIGLFTTTTTITAEAYKFEGEPQKCEKIQVNICSDINYNHTIMPNLADQSNQRDAELQLFEFIPLIKTKCSPWLKFFLCSVYFPLCTEQVDEILTIPPCRSMCLGVKDKCEAILQQVGLKWPDVLDCGKLPEKNERHSNLCIEPPLGYHDNNNNVEEDVKNHFAHNNNNNNYNNNYKDQSKKSGNKINGKQLEGMDSSSVNLIDKADAYNLFDIFKLGQLQQQQQLLQQQQLRSSTTVRTHRKIFAEDLKSISVYRIFAEDSKCPPRYVNVDTLLNRKQNDTCAPRCGPDVMYRQGDKRFAEIWMIIWTSFCFVSTFITFVTFLMDTSRFDYPERPIIYLSTCCLVYSCGYIVRLARGSHETSCEEAKSGMNYIIQEGLENTWCVAVFLILYYFGMASCIWWVFLTITFYLSAGRKWSSEALQGANNYFHVIAWTLPAVLTITVLTMRRIDGDELTGLCFVGNQDMTSLLTFVIVPLVTCLIVGSCFIMAGFFAMFRIRQDLKLDGTDVKKFERLMIKIGVFSILYTVPTTCVIGCLIYERLNHKVWKMASYSLPCIKFDDVGNNLLFVDCSLEKSIPTLEVQVLKVFMLLIIGTASGTWIWSPKTIQTWKTFVSRICSLASKKSKTKETVAKIYSPNNASSVITRPSTTIVATSYQLVPPAKGVV